MQPSPPGTPPAAWALRCAARVRYRPDHDRPWHRRSCAAQPTPLLFSLLFTLCIAPIERIGPAHADPRAGLLSPCRLPGSETELQCGSIRRPLVPAQEGTSSTGSGPQIDIHFAVLPAIARNKKPDPVFFFAGGPGQSAMRLVGPIGTLFKRLQNRRDIVFVDQRGTGRSAPLDCPELPPSTPLAEALRSGDFGPYLSDCLSALQRLPHGDLRQYTTTLAMQDVDAVRQALGAAQINVIGGSYGTRAALEYMRQFPAQLRRVIIDGVAPPDMKLPATLGTDAQAALSTWLTACEQDADCNGRHPGLRARFATLLASLPKEISVTHPHSGQLERLTLRPDDVLGLVHGPLYAPWLASAVPLALAQASEGRFEALFGLGSSLGSGDSTRLALGMHFAVICSEDVPAEAQASAQPTAPTDAGQPAADRFARRYAQICAHVPRASVPAAFFFLPKAPAATLVFSGGLDPVTPPRHGQRVAQALGDRARHVVVPNAGHGVLPLPCIPDVVHRFIEADDDRAALAIDAGCASGVPRPTPYRGIVADPEVRR